MLWIPKRVWDAVVSHAAELYPEECCGVLVGAVDRVDYAVRLTNASETDRRGSYRITPADLLAATHQARARGMRILAVYHSHPDSEPRFSAEDASNACPWYQFLVVAVCGGLIGAARCYQPAAGSRAFEEVGFEIETTASAE